MVEDGEAVEWVRREETIWRRLHAPGHVARDGKRWRVSSGAFRARNKEDISVHREALTSEQWVLEHYPGVGIAALTVAQVEEIEPLRVKADPVAGDPLVPDDPSHALIVPYPTGGQATRLAARARPVRLPDGVAGEDS